MERELREQIICCMMAAILLFMGMSVDAKAAKSSVYCGTTEENAYLSSVSYIVEDVVICTPGMLIKNNILVARVNTAPSVLKWNRMVPLIPILGTFLQYLFLYQKAESKEDAQLFLCRSLIIDYIHLKDSGE